MYRARDVRLGRDVAIKILSASLGVGSGRRECFEREARIISSLNYPNICALYDIGREGNTTSSCSSTSTANRSTSGSPRRAGARCRSSWRCRSAFKSPTARVGTPTR